MEFSLAAQTKVFLCTVIFGVCLGAVYDFFKALRLMMKAKRPGTAVCDLIFCLVAFVLFLLFMLSIGGGELRGYILFGMALGAALYFSAFSELFIKFFTLFLKGLREAAILWRKLFEMPRGN